MPKCNACDNGAAKCPDCKGKGKKDYGTFVTDWGDCKHCGGSGKKLCGVCKGRGTI